MIIILLSSSQPIITGFKGKLFLQCNIKHRGNFPGGGGEGGEYLMYMQVNLGKIKTILINFIVTILAWLYEFVAPYAQLFIDNLRACFPFGSLWDCAYWSDIDSWHACVPVDIEAYEIVTIGLALIVYELYLDRYESGSRFRSRAFIAWRVIRCNYKRIEYSGTNH